MPRRSRQHEDWLTAQHVTRTLRLLAGVLALAIAFASPATCFAAIAQMSEGSQHACCEGMQQDCGADTLPVEMDCCAVQSADIVRAVSSMEAVSPLIRTLATPFIVVPSVVAGISAPSAFDPGTPRPSSSPTYVLVSVFRL